VHNTTVVNFPRRDFCPYYAYRLGNLSTRAAEAGGRFHFCLVSTHLPHEGCSCRMRSSCSLGSPRPSVFEVTTHRSPSGVSTASRTRPTSRYERGSPTLPSLVNGTYQRRSPRSAATQTPASVTAIPDGEASLVGQVTSGLVYSDSSTHPSTCGHP